MDSKEDKKDEIITNIDDEDVSPASRPTHPHGLFFDFKFANPTMSGLTISEDALTGLNHGIGWRTLLGDQTIHFENNPGKYYFDIRINNMTPNWGNSIGVADKAYNNSGTTILGYKEYGSAKSWAWFTYPQNLQGFLHDGVNVGEKPTPFITGDIIRIVIETADKSISFYRNEEFIAKPFIDIDSNEIVPAFTLCGGEDSITIMK